MPAPVIVALTPDYIEQVRQQLHNLGWAITTADVREALEVAAGAPAPQPDLFGGA